MVHALADGPQPWPQLQGAHVEHQAPRLGPGHIQQVAHQFVQSLQVLFHEAVDPLALLWAQFAGEEGLRPHPQRGDGGLQLLGDGGGEVPLAQLEVELLRELAVEEDEAEQHCEHHEGALGAGPEDGVPALVPQLPEGAGAHREVGGPVQQEGVVRRHGARDQLHLGIGLLDGLPALGQAGHDRELPRHRAARGGGIALGVEHIEDLLGVQLPGLGPRRLQGLGVHLQQAAGIPDLEADPPAHLEAQDHGHGQEDDPLQGEGLGARGHASILAVSPHGAILESDGLLVPTLRPQADPRPLPGRTRGPSPRPRDRPRDRGPGRSPGTRPPDPRARSCWRSWCRPSGNSRWRCTRCGSCAPS